jgi:hypothetical protein
MLEACHVADKLANHIALYPNPEDGQPHPALPARVGPQALQHIISDLRRKRELMLFLQA